MQPRDTGSNIIYIEKAYMVLAQGHAHESLCSIFVALPPNILRKPSTFLLTTHHSVPLHMCALHLNVEFAIFSFY